jgi:signal transduction histidine kinase
VEIGELPQLEADPLQMRQLLQNLIGNALKFHRPEAPPVVRLDSQILADGVAVGEEIVTNGDHKLYQLTVADNGIGFDEKYLDRIFTPFQRLHSRNEYEGTGMGLAVCRKIVERHGGSITAKSTPGSGTTFQVILPATHTEGDTDS